jgi:hypothetical protein
MLDKVHSTVQSESSSDHTQSLIRQLQSPQRLPPVLTLYIKSSQKSNREYSKSKLFQPNSHSTMIAASVDRALTCLMFDLNQTSAFRAQEIGGLTRHACDPHLKKARKER